VRRSRAHGEGVDRDECAVRTFRRVTSRRRDADS
jgi:hypothetical protein